jgi:glycerophosphoryl diester phosphodiesterase
MTLVLAQRGACREAPENSLAAFELAIEQGADYVGFDVRSAPNGKLVVARDPVRPDALPDASTLDEVLEALRGRVGLAIEPGDGAAVAGALARLRAHRVAAADVLVLSRRIRHLWHAQRSRPDLRYVLMLGRRPDPSAAARLWGVGFDDRAARPRQIALARSLGLGTTVSTVDDPARMEELAALGVDGIFTSRPGLARETLAGAAMA